MTTPLIRSPLWLLVACCIAALVPTTTANDTPQRRMTAFDPAVHGFNFRNTFDNDVIPEIDLRTSGLCGGMVYSALDYFNANATAVPRQDYRPANQTALQRYIYDRQVDSLAPNLVRWADVALRARSGRSDELFRRAVATEASRLRAFIDAGRPAPLGVQGTRGAQHQVLAIGYEQGDGPEDLTVFLYDPNLPNQTVAMKANPEAKRFDYEGRNRSWRTFFVDDRYTPEAPIELATPDHPRDGLVRELLVRVRTGADDLRGGATNADLRIHLRGAPPVVCPNINLGARWLANYTEAASVTLPAPITRDDIESIEITSAHRRDDAWDAMSIIVEAYTGGMDRQVITQTAVPVRFSAALDTLTLDVEPVTAPEPTNAPDTR